MTKLGSGMARLLWGWTNPLYALALSVSVRRVSGSPLLHALAPAPFRHERCPSLGNALGGGGNRADPIHPEMAEALAQLAPGNDHPHLLEEGERDRPDHPLAVAASA